MTPTNKETTMIDSTDSTNMTWTRDAAAREIGAAWGEADRKHGRPAKADAEIVRLVREEADGQPTGWSDEAAVRGYRAAYSGN